MASKRRQGRHRFVGKEPKTGHYKRMDVRTYGGKDSALHHLVNTLKWTNISLWPPPRAFDADLGLLLKARNYLGVTCPVDIRHRPGQGRDAVYRGFPSGRHLITVESSLGWSVDPLRGPVLNYAYAIQRSSEALWHELTHALQAERDGSHEARQARVRRERNMSYARRPSEIEAAANERLAHEVGFITKRVPVRSY